MSKKTAFKGATLIPCTGEAAIQDSLVMIDGDTIEYAGPDKKEIDKADYEVIDVQGKTIMAGMTEAHTHLCGTVNPAPDEWLMEENTYEAIVAATQAKKLLDYGFTSVRDISRFGLDLKKAIGNGIIQGPRIFATGRGLCRTGGHGDWPALPREIVEARHPWATVADTPQDCRKKTRELLSHNVDGIKIWASGGGIHEADIEMDQHYSYEEIKAVVEEANYLGKPVISHCESLESAKYSIKAGCKSIEHGEEMDDECIQLMKEMGTFFVPTLMVFVNWFTRFEAPYRPILDEFPGETLGEKELNRIFANFRKCKDAGIPIAVGADSFASSFTPYGSDSLKEIHCFVDAGCTEMEALICATKTGAELLGFGEITGTVEAGKKADLIVLDKNPLDDIKNLSKENMALIMKEGEVICAPLFEKQ